ncbi:DNA topoisomerase IB [Oleiharenicola lentus]|uniref:DNA topoisomerase IB n=1 Tax=Oleiharenicola lentus TaxID=2508720 RepID=UPI003F680D6F
MKSLEEIPALVAKAKSAAKDAGLRYVSDGAPGIKRERVGANFRYRTADGGLVRRGEEVARLRRLGIPPAWTDVWICNHANGHIQATGRDARGRKQYRYHPDWRETRDATKFERMIAFGRALPKIRRRVNRDLRKRDLGRDKVLAAIVRLLEETHIRVGNEEYAKQNHSFGLSTMRDRHVEIRGGTLKFHFLGKSGKTHDVELHDPRLAKIVRASQELPGQELFQYVDEAGQRQKVNSDDVNAYLRAAAGEEFSAKDFRTWAGTVLAALELHEFASGEEKPTKKNLGRAIERVAACLGNTPAICRKSYVHPVVMNAYLAGNAVRFPEKLKRNLLARMNWELEAEEAVVLKFLERALKQPKRKSTLTSLLRRSLQRNGELIKSA